MLIFRLVSKYRYELFLLNMIWACPAAFLSLGISPPKCYLSPPLVDFALSGGSGHCLQVLAVLHFVTHCCGLYVAVPHAAWGGGSVTRIICLKRVFSTSLLRELIAFNYIF